MKTNFKTFETSNAEIIKLLQDNDIMPVSKFDGVSIFFITDKLTQLLKNNNVEVNYG